jgi:hypothetical protein
MSENIIATISASSRIGVSTLSEGGRTLSELTDIDLQGVTNGSLLVYDTNEFVARTLSGDASINSAGVLTLNPNAVSLGTDTSGAYVSTLTGTTDQIVVIGSGGETANVTLSLASTGVDAGQYNNSSSSITPFTVDAKGRITAVSTPIPLTPTWINIVDRPSTLVGYGITDAASSIALSNHISDDTIHLTNAQNTLLDGITVTSDKINYLSSISSNVQTQLDGKQSLDADLTAIAALSETNGFLKKSASNTWTLDSSNYSLTSHSHTNATSVASGFLSASDKTKLDNIPAGVNYGVVTNAFPAGFSSGIASINWQAGTYWSGYLGLVGGTLIQFQNVIPGKIIILSITGSGSPVAWPNGITWLAGSAPSLSVSGQTRIIKILATSVSTFIGAVDTI